MPKAHLLTYDEIARFLRIAGPMGIRKVRLTGGEPLARRDLTELVRMIGAIPEITELALSTNAVLFAPHAEQLKRDGLHRVNISLDTLRRDRFQQITGFDRWQQVWDGIQTALAVGLHPVKVNAVLVRGINDDEVEDFVAWTRTTPVHVRFIEYMPVGTFDQWERAKVVPIGEVLERIRSIADLEPIERERATAGPADEWRVVGGAGSVGVITAVTSEFCEACNRIRLTSDGKLRGCLLSNGELDLRENMRAGIDDDGLRELLLECMRRKPEKHLINADDMPAPAYQMHQMGG
jgi:cyclic pyranopterin phosphate synthase